MSLDFISDLNILYNRVSTPAIGKCPKALVLLAGSLKLLVLGSRLLCHVLECVVPTNPVTKVTRLQVILLFRSFSVGGRLRPLLLSKRTSRYFFHRSTASSRHLDMANLATDGPIELQKVRARVIKRAHCDPITYLIA